jgi:HEAT repeat protein
VLAAAAAGASIQRVETMRYALVVGPAAPGEPARELESVLRDRFGYQVFVLPAAEASREQVRELMAELGGLVRPYDELVVLVGLPFLRDLPFAKGGSPGAVYVPADGDRESPWTLLTVRELAGWLSELPTGGALLVHPGCGGAIAGVDDPELAALGYGKRPGAIDVLAVCDLRTTVPAEATGAGAPRDWRAGELAGALARILREDAPEEAGAWTSGALARRLEGELAGLRLGVRPYPRGDREFAFRPVDDEAGYRQRYEKAPSYDEARSLLVGFAGRAGERPSLEPGLVRMLGQVALDPRAAATSARPDESGALELRRFAVELLARLASEPARDAVAEIAARADAPAVRAYAVSLLARRAPLIERESAALRAASRDADAGVREAAVLGLGLANDPEAAASYRRLLRSDPSPAVRVAALQALAALGRAEDRDLFLAQLGRQESELRRAAVAALAQLGPSPEASTALLERLSGDADEQVRQHAAYALGQTWEESVRAPVTTGLVAALETAPEGVARAAAASLGRLGGEPVERALVGQLAPPDVALLDPELHPPGLKFAPESVRVAAAEALGRMRSAAAVPMLTRLAEVECTAAALKEPDLERLKRRACVEPAPVRRAAVSALAAIGGAGVAETLYRKLEDPDPFVRREASRVLGKETASRDYVPTREVILRQSAPTRQFSYRNVDPADPRALELLLHGLSDESNEARAEAIASLAKLTDPAAIARVAGVLREGDLLGRQSAAVVLGRVVAEDPAVVEALAAGARDPTSSAVRSAAVRALGLRHDPRGREPLLAATGDPTAEVRRAAAEALGGWLDDPEARSRLEVLAKTDEAPEVRAAAISALGYRVMKK